MKMRLRGNSIRLRLTRGEVESFAAGAAIVETVDFGSGRGQLRYSLVSSSDAMDLSAEFSGGTVRVTVPHGAAAAWAGSEQVGLESAGGPLRLLVEKDFACLSERAGEDETDAFPNPNAGAC